jgi:hypothetical protein
MGMVWVMTRANNDEVAAVRGDPESVYDFINSEAAYESGRGLDLDKQWHAIHFLLTGAPDVTDSPLSLIVGSFEEIGPDNGYGSAWFVPNKALTAFNSALAARSDREWVAQYDAAAAVREQVYLAETLAEEGEEALEFLEGDVARLRAFVADAVVAGDSAFAVIT